MGERPNFIDLHAKSPDPSARLGHPSPRIQYNEGEIPPCLSPLDAFAAQSRLMAKQLDVKMHKDKRMSRLPPAVVTKSLSQHRAERPTVFRSFSEESDGDRVRDEDEPSSSSTIAHPQDRHISQYPRISGLLKGKGKGTDEDEDKGESFMIPMDRASTPETTCQPATQSDYFGLPRADSPISTSLLADCNVARRHAKAEPSLTSSSPGRQHLRSRYDSSTSHPDSKCTSHSPTRPAPQRESSDDDYTSSVAGSSFSFPRKLSASSGISVPHSPLSPFIPIHPPRSPSIQSEASVTGASAHRTHLNFSRPRSTASLSILSRADSPALRQLVDPQNLQPSAATQGDSQYPVQSEAVELVDNDGYLSAGGSSYTYAKFSLPRGRVVSRDSVIFQGLSTPHFEWKEPLFQNTPLMGGTPDRPLVSPSPAPDLKLGSCQTKSKIDGDLFAFDIKSTRPATPKIPMPKKPLISPSQSLKSAKSTSSLKGRTSVETGDLGWFRASAAQRIDSEDSKSTSSRSNSTLRPMSAKTGVNNATNYQYMSPDDHVTKGIECHENGSLQESTYHLRIAAMQNHPTAMLLYALACRHGWGMRPNQREGVQWLRKALDSAMHELKEDEDPSNAIGLHNISDQKARRAQFALGVYELGVSHLNGWGIDRDKALALRCFEVAGHWGDVDALTEAGFCYAEGVGCKKDLKKAARFYRMAEQRGANMVGNSW
ncbi:hypothetical protein EPUS_00879 [Endocarpon pusillum Z07020]|uniref:Protein DSF2 n=1 Tax=Endocarpon pusillum (strain Z07020 / HMAS-L-300199) TaxID=1263415 RepID=U1GNY7_ENDPU|nr:uncharacterized protein EPUS_00879 [Endocarpon pusillum Z07020]ERF73626.1 hypothetical protein EPUS_00879 [Endocarpon pusillum Z07020]